MIALISIVTLFILPALLFVPAMILATFRLLIQIVWGCGKLIQYLVRGEV